MHTHLKCQLMKRVYPIYDTLWRPKNPLLCCDQQYQGSCSKCTHTLTQRCTHTQRFPRIVSLLNHQKACSVISETLLLQCQPLSLYLSHLSASPSLYSLFAFMSRVVPHAQRTTCLLWSFLQSVSVRWERWRTHPTLNSQSVWAGAGAWLVTLP